MAPPNRTAPSRCRRPAAGGCLLDERRLSPGEAAALGCPVQFYLAGDEFVDRDRVHGWSPGCLGVDPQDAVVQGVGDPQVAVCDEATAVVAADVYGLDPSGGEVHPDQTAAPVPDGAVTYPSLGRHREPQRVRIGGGHVEEDVALDVPAGGLVDCS